jgi:hypothetical protein
MSAIPVHLERRFERRWASRFGSRVASTASKSAGTKSKLPHSTEDNPPIPVPAGLGKRPSLIELVWRPSFEGSHAD